jgi:hypothetical protein
MKNVRYGVLNSGGFDGEVEPLRAPFAEADSGVAFLGEGWMGVGGAGVEGPAGDFGGRSEEGTRGGGIVSGGSKTGI